MRKRWAAAFWDVLEMNAEYADAKGASFMRRFRAHTKFGKVGIKISFRYALLHDSNSLFNYPIF
jgi:hypothetical protein